jgi:hypothetical protein
MAQDTAQLSGAAETDPNAQLENAADAFKAFDNPVANRKRDEVGRFASDEQPDETDQDTEEEPEAAVADEGEAEDEADDEAADEAQPLPPSWPEDMAEHWTQLPAETQAFLANREAERERAVNAKFQESANVRKAYEAKQAEANARLDEFSRTIDTVEAIYKSPEPDPRAFGYGTAQYNEAAYHVAHREWQQTEQVLAQLNEQREAARKQQTEAEKAAYSEWKQQHEAEFAPKLLADVPGLKDPLKADATARELVTYAIANGIPQDVFAEDVQDQITAAQLHLLWKAQQFDKLRANKTAPKKPVAGPAVKPGVSSPRSAQKAVRQKNAMDRLAREGSIEAGAAVFKNLFKG